MNIEINDLANTVQKKINLYREDLQEEIAEVFEDVAAEGVEEIKKQSQNAEFQSRNYHKGWTKAIKKDKVTGQYHITIYNKKYYRLTHLLEKGHALVNGGRTRAFPHIKPTQDKMDKLIVEKLEGVIQK